MNDELHINTSVWVELPAWLESQLCREQKPILAKNNGGEWMVVYTKGEPPFVATDVMSEAEWERDHPPVLRLWDGEKIEYATAE